MARALTGGMVTEVSGASLSPILFLKLSFQSGDVNLWTGYGNIDWNSETWVGAGTLLVVGAVVESLAIEAVGASFTLSGMPSAIIAIALAEDYQGRDALLYFAALDADGAVISNPDNLFLGFMDTMEIVEGAETTSVTIMAENHLARLGHTRKRRYTHEDQAIEFPGDTGFSKVAALQQAEFLIGPQA